MTQLELAEKINYSDKSVSKWERGESLPDIVVLKAVADLFEVTLDYLVEEEHDGKPVTKEMVDKNYRRNCCIITGTSIFIVEHCLPKAQQVTGRAVVFSSCNRFHILSLALCYH